MTEVEKLAQEIFDEAIKDNEPMSMEDATEIAKIEIKAKDVKIYAQAPKKRKQAKREQKIDQDKINLIDFIKNCINIRTTQKGGISNLNISNPQREITFDYNGFNYSVTLTKHRKK